eukprot:1582210-Rhodomonas_salina.1
MPWAIKRRIARYGEGSGGHIGEDKSVGCGLDKTRHSPGGADAEWSSEDVEVLGEAREGLIVRAQLLSAKHAQTWSQFHA